MDITITINTDNAAFGDSPELETARILRDLAEKLEMASFRSAYDRTVNLRDINGNTVGKFVAK